MLKCNQYSKVISSTPTHFGKKTKCMVIKSMKPSATSVKKIMTPGLGDQALGWGQCGQIVKLH